MKLRKSMCLLVLVGLVAMGLSIAPPALAKTRMMFATGPSTGGWYPTGARIAEVIMKGNPNLDVTVVEGGATGNLRDVNSNQAQIGYTFSSSFEQALRGMKPFRGKLTKVAGFLTLYKSHYQAFTKASSSIKSFAGLDGKSIAPGVRNWGGELLTRAVLAAYGLNYDKIKDDGGKVNFVGYSDMAMLMRDNHVAACMILSAAPSAMLMDLMATHEIRFLQIDKKHAEEIMAKNPGFTYDQIPANTYKQQDKPVDTLAVYTITMVNKDLPVETVYGMTKAVMENLDEVHKAHPVVRYLTKETALEGFDLKNVHPGVIKYFKEIGVIK
ncbi:MAG: TAXI family TRAP transporter solute-binding subunit [Desulfarculaceae bacterium]|nr:TAXI family TRAP transporter solute-binding subunit [Desulfarculaceae bacterium]